MSQPDLKALLQALQQETVSGLLARLRSGEATAADYNVARQLLKDHNVEAIPLPGSPLAGLSKAITDTLPFAGSEGPSH